MQLAYVNVSSNTSLVNFEGLKAKFDNYILSAHQQCGASSDVVGSVKPAYMTGASATTKEGSGSGSDSDDDVWMHQLPVRLPCTLNPTPTHPNPRPAGYVRQFASWWWCMIAVGFVKLDGPMFPLLVLWVD